jgi:hypothetical protein
MKKLFGIITLVLLTLTVSAQTYKGATSIIRKEDKLNEIYCTGMFKSTDGTILDIAGNTSTLGTINILNWLQGRVAGLQVFTSRTGMPIPMIRGSIPGIYVDEIPVSISFLSSLPVSDIAIVKVIKTPFYGGFNGGGGAIAVYTLGGEEEEEE